MTQTLLAALKGKGIEAVYFDCVVNEAISVIARRVEEQKRPEQLSVLLDRLLAEAPETDIVWISSETQ